MGLENKILQVVEDLDYMNFYSGKYFYWWENSVFYSDCSNTEFARIILETINKMFLCEFEMHYNVENQGYEFRRKI